MATCFKCGAEAGFFKEVCSGCPDTAPKDQVFNKIKHRYLSLIAFRFRAPANDQAPTDTQQEVTQGEEVGEISAKTKISRTFSIALFVIAGLAAVYLVGFFGDLSDSTEKVSSTLNTVAESEPFWGGLGAILGGIGWFFVLIAAFIIAGPVAIVIMAIFGTGLIASSASDNPEKRGTVAKVARGCGITALWVSGLFCVAILILFSGVG
jgi:hypothetical protein